MAGHSEIATDTDKMAGDIEKLRNALGVAKKQLEKMFNEEKALDATWEGPTHSEFVEQITADRTMCEESFKTIEKTIDSMEKAKIEYIKCDEEVGDIISSI